MSAPAEAAERPFPTTTCDSCNAEIIWAVTMKGERMPVDAHPMVGGNLKLWWNAGQVRSAVADPRLAFGAKRWQSHFARCPQANRWRRKRRTA